jgi:sigma-B regulation protein RsbU (phosphoserine phosphatase)
VARWRVATGSLVPLVPAVVFFFADVGDGSSVVILLAAVIAAGLLGGWAAGIASVVLSTFLYDLAVLPPRGKLTLSREAWPHLGGFALTAVAVVAVVVSLQLSSRRAQRGRLAAEDRARRLSEHVELVGPVLDTAPVGFAVFDGDLRYRYVNARLAAINGLPEAAHLGKRPRDLFPPETAAAMEAPSLQVLATGEPQQREQWTVPLGGTARHFLGSRYPVRDAKGAVVGLLVSVVDMTEQIELQQRQARTVAELITTIESAPVAIALVDPNLRLQRVNQAFLELCGRPGGSVLGRPVADCLPLPVDLGELCRRTLTGDHPVAEAEFAVPGAGGTPRELAVSCAPARLEDGTVVGTAIMVSDVTERRRVAHLEAEAQRLRATAELAHKLEEAQRLAGIGSWDYDPEQRRFTLSRQLQAILGVDDPAAIPAGGPVHPDDAARAAEARRGLLEEGRAFSVELRLIRPDGTVIDVISTGEVFQGDSGEPLRMWGTVQDVTEQRRLERAGREAVRRAEQVRSQLESEHQALQMFQRAMLPAELPSVPGAEVAAVYLPVAERLDIGGDWYDAFVLPDGRVVLAVGDVTGHDLRAATVMGQVRNAVRAYASEDPTPGEVLRRVNTLLSRLPDLDLVTMLYGVYDPQSHELVWSNAGHPPPLLRHGGHATALTDAGGLLLGVLPDEGPYPQHRLTLAPGDAVLWYTDGLVDQRDVDPAVALDRLTGFFADSAGNASEMVESVSEGMLRDSVQEDDICLLTLRHLTPAAGDRVRHAVGRLWSRRGAASDPQPATEANAPVDADAAA